jgi:zinc transport system substrate-binding protein
MWKKFALIILLLVLGVFVFFQIRKIGLSSLRNSSSQAHPSTLTVTASFYPLAEFAQKVGGDKVHVHNLTPAGSEPHDFDPSPLDLVLLQNSQVFVYNGAGLELWLNKISDDVKQKVIMVNASEGMTLLKSSADKTANTDPHVWMDPVLAIQEVEQIKLGLTKADPTNAPMFEHNATAYQKQLSDLDAEFQKGLAQCQTREIVTSHNAFQYLAQRYHLKVLSISGLSPDEEPSPKKLVEVVEFAKQHHVKYIFFETLVSSKLSETIGKETGAQTIAFNPLEGLTPAEIKAGKDYISIQQENLAALRTALQCQ